MQWNIQLVEQLGWHWENHLRPRLAGLSDDEYFWEPVPGSWSVRRRGESSAPLTGGSGEFVLEFARPEPTPAPLTTIAWRIGHIVGSVLGKRTSRHFGGPPVDWDTFDYAGNAETALEQLDTACSRWLDGVRGLGEEGLTRPCGPVEGPFAQYPLATLILHINREVIHHGAEILLLRDLYRHREVS